jgi:hypothetical protein
MVEESLYIELKLYYYTKYRDVKRKFRLFIKIISLYFKYL